MMPAESFWFQAQQLMPDQSWTLLRLPRKPDDSVYLEVLEGDVPHDLAKSYLTFDAYSGQVTSVRHYRTDTPAGRKLYLWMIELHSAAWGGLAYQSLLFLCAIGMGVQYYSGASPWLRRKLRRPALTRLLLRVTKKEQEALDICTFELADPKGRSLPPFSAGSHIDVTLPDGKIRQYSLCNDPEDRHRYLIGVLRMANGRGGSMQMHDQVREGDLIEIGVPRNHFPLAHGARHSLLLAGGIGITPILCMAERLSNIGADFTLHYSVRSLERAAFRERIAGSDFAAQVRLHCDDGPEDQRFDIAGTLERQPSDTHLYVCGPGGFMDAVLSAAQKLGWPESRLHREYFAGQVTHSDQDRKFQVKIASSGQVVTVPKDRSVVDALSDCGIFIQTSCGTGVCGTCLTRVIEGDPDHRDLFQTAEERARNDQFTPCCSRARSEMLVLDL
jgi:vanillate O-demethylase ferredoxin subunit